MLEKGGGQVFFSLSMLQVASLAVAESLSCLSSHWMGSPGRPPPAIPPALATTVLVVSSGCSNHNCLTILCWPFQLFQPVPDQFPRLNTLHSTTVVSVLQIGHSEGVEEPEVSQQTKLTKQNKTKIPFQVEKTAWAQSQLERSDQGNGTMFCKSLGNVLENTISNLERIRSQRPLVHKMRAMGFIPHDWRVVEGDEHSEVTRLILQEVRAVNDR